MDLSHDTHDTQYTIDTIIPISKNYLKKTLIKSEAANRANQEMIKLYKDAFLKQKNKLNQNHGPRVIETIKYVKKDVTLSEQYDIFNKIKYQREKENDEKIMRDNKRKEYVLEQRKQLEKEKIALLQQSEEYQIFEEEYKIWDQCYNVQISNKKKDLKIYKEILDNNPNDDRAKINSYNLFFNIR
jgi:hypothetical protein